jgi:hypothetical protein
MARTTDKPAVQPDPTPAELPTKTPAFEIVGLKKSDQMIVYYGGEKYNLASLTDIEATKLIEGKYPHLVRS